jgi:hypothetical protein
MSYSDTVLKQQLSFIPKYTYRVGREKLLTR